MHLCASSTPLRTEVGEQALDKTGTFVPVHDEQHSLPAVPPDRQPPSPVANGTKIAGSLQSSRGRSCSRNRRRCPAGSCTFSGSGSRWWSGWRQCTAAGAAPGKRSQSAEEPAHKRKFFALNNQCNKDALVQSLKDRALRHMHTVRKTTQDLWLRRVCKTACGMPHERLVQWSLALLVASRFTSMRVRSTSPGARCRVCQKASTETARPSQEPLASCPGSSCRAGGSCPK